MVVASKAYPTESFVRLIRTGEIAAGGRRETGFVGDVAGARFSVLTDAEMAALWHCLHSR